MVALTFDAEPGGDAGSPSVGAAGWAEILTELGREGVKATFFVQGDWAAQHPDLLRRTVAEGHLIGNHTLNHLHLESHPDRISDQVETGAAILRAIAPGAEPRPWLRLPGLQGERSAVVRDALEAIGWEHVSCNCSTSDWNPATATPEAAAALALGDYDSLPSAPHRTAIILCHTWPECTAPALAPLIQGLRHRGASFVRVDEIPREERRAILSAPRTWSLSRHG